MKMKILLLLILTIYQSSNYQTFSQQKPSLKGFTIGAKIGNQVNNKMTTVGGVNGFLYVETLNDGTIYSIVFIPAISENEQLKMTINEVESLKKKFENNFSIYYKKKDEKPKEPIYHTYQNMISYSIYHNRNATLFSIVDIVGSGKANIQKQEKDKRDF